MKKYCNTKTSINKSSEFAEKKNIVYISILAWILSVGVILEFINTNLRLQFNFASTSKATLIIYAIVFAISMLKVKKFKGFTNKGVLIYISILGFFILNYLLFKNNRSYYLDNNMLLIYFFFLPISIFVIRNISNWDVALPIFRKYAFFMIFLSTLGITVVGYSKVLIYMEFAYTLLPFIAIMYCTFRQNHKLIDLVGFFAGFIDIIVFGARAPILFLALFIIAYEFIMFKYSKNSSKISIIAISIIAFFTLLIFGDSIITILMKITQETDSRFLTTMLNGTLIKDPSRNIIYEEANQALRNMGVGMYGIFGDRLVLHAVYVHNIFYEFLLSFGYFFGSICILIFFYMLLKVILINKDNTITIIALIFTVSLFFRYLVSGSFVIEGKFYIYIAVLINLFGKAGVKKKNEESKYNCTSL